MSSEVFNSQVIPASGQWTGSRGRIWNLLSASAAVSITCDAAGGRAQASVRTFASVPAGAKFTGARGEEWTYLRVTGAPGTVFSIFIGDDDVSFSNAVTVSGSVATVPAANTAVNASGADTVQANASATSIALNGLRKSLTIGALSTNTGSLRVQSPGAGANRGWELQPGQTITLQNTAAVDVRNDSGAAQSWWKFEEQ